MYKKTKKNKMSENDFEIQNNYPPIEQLQLDNPQVPPIEPPKPPSSDTDKESCEWDDTPIKIPDCKPTCVPITLELSPVISLLVNKPKVCIKNMAVCKPKFFLNQ